MTEHLDIGIESAPRRMLTELTALATTQPKIDEREMGGPSVHTQYRENFFRRFIDLRAIRTETATDEQVFYMRMVKERFGLDLLGFYAEQEPLCDAICDAIDAKEPYDRLVAGRDDVRLLEDAHELPLGSTQELDAATGHSLGIEAVGIYYWEQINPLLERAYSLLEERTLNAPFLTR